jgi:hypothetical protein
MNYLILGTDWARAGIARTDWARAGHMHGHEIEHGHGQIGHGLGTGGLGTVGLCPNVTSTH